MKLPHFRLFAPVATWMSSALWMRQLFSILMSPHELCHGPRLKLLYSCLFCTAQNYPFLYPVLFCFVTSTATAPECLRKNFMSYIFLYKITLRKRHIIIFISWGQFLPRLEFIIKSQTHRMSWVGKDLKNHLLSSPCHAQGYLPLHQVAQGPIQPGFEYFHGWSIHRFSGLPVSVPQHHQSTEFLPNS